MKNLVLWTAFVGLSAAMAHASSVDLTLHTTGDTPIIDLSTILNQWGTPSDTSSAFTIGGSGTDFIDGLNLVNDTGFAITSLAVYAYGTIGPDNSYTGTCTNGSGSPLYVLCGSRPPGGRHDDFRECSDRLDLFRRRLHWDGY